MTVVGFDVGNDTYTVAVAREHRVYVILNDAFKRETPSVVSFNEKQRSFGVASLTNPKNTVSQIKRLLGVKFADPQLQADLQSLPFKITEGSDGFPLVHVNYLGEERKFTPSQLFAMVLSNMKGLAEKNLKGLVIDCCIGIPVYFTDLQRRAVLDAATIAGLCPLRLIHETTAAALAYGDYKTDLSETEPTNVAFVDIGHTSMQVCIAAFKKGQLKILSHSWDASLGGRDFDNVLYRYFTSKFKSEYHIDMPFSPRVSGSLRTACEKLKKTLSTNSEVSIFIKRFMDDKDLKGFMKRDEFEKLSAPILGRVLEPLNKAVAESGLTLEEVHSVEVVGSGSRIPAILKILTTFFGKEPRRTMDATECVARGCALQGVMLSPTFRVRDFQVDEKLPFSVSLAWKDLKTDDQKSTVVFPKGNMIPSRKFVSFYRSGTFTIDLVYAEGSTKISSHTIGPFQTRNSEYAKLKVKVRLNLHGNVSIDKAYLTEREIVEVPVSAQQEVPLKKVKKITVPVSELIHGAMTSGDLQKAIELELEMALQDRIVEETKSKEEKNAVEAYNHDLSNKILGLVDPNKSGILSQPETKFAGSTSAENPPPEMSAGRKSALPVTPQPCRKPSQSSAGTTSAKIPPELISAGITSVENPPSETMSAGPASAEISPLEMNSAEPTSSENPPEMNSAEPTSELPVTPQPCSNSPRYPESDLTEPSGESGMRLVQALSLMLQDGYNIKQIAREESKRREEVEKKILETCENVLLSMNQVEAEIYKREKQYKNEIAEIHVREFETADFLKREIEELKFEKQCLQNLRDEDLIQLEELNKQKQELEKQHKNEIAEIRVRESETADLVKREIEELKFENQQLRNLRDEDLIQLEELNKQKQELEKHISDLEEYNNRLVQERDDATKEAVEMRNQKEHLIDSVMSLSSKFSSSELEQATENFSESLKIGEGGFGCVYKGTLRGTTVAIKKLNSQSLQGISQFQQEVAILTKVRHPNLVNLIGSCPEVSALVYEFLPNGSLEDHLDSANNTTSLTWQARTHIISEICLALVFLHSSNPHLVIHGDLKPDNILLDTNFMSKLSDFGISRIIKQSDTDLTAFYMTNHPAGTFAYLDPEFLRTGKMTTKSDVYPFGIIVLRLLTGKPPLNIATVVQEAMQSGELGTILDESAGKWPFELAEKLAELGLRCADMLRKNRPDMTQVWTMIEPLVKIASQSPELSSNGSMVTEEHIPSHFICPISREIMMNPCIAADGFTYEAEVIKTWFNTGHNTSPMTNLMLPHLDLIPNLILRSAIQEWQEHHPSFN